MDNSHHEDALNEVTLVKRVDADEVYVMDLADIHCGAKGCLIDKLKDIVLKILSIPHLYVIVGGDSTESSTTTSASSVFDEVVHGADQIIMLRDILKPLADADRILFVRSGNHGLQRAKKHNNTPPEQILAALLGVPFFRGAGIVILNCRKNQYVIGSWHTRRKPDKFEWLQTNVNFMEHLHKADQETVLYAVPNRINKKWMVRPTINVNVSSFLGWAGYAMDAGYRPLPNLCPVAVFSGRKEDWNVFALPDIGVLDRFKRV